MKVNETHVVHLSEYSHCEQCCAILEPFTIIIEDAYENIYCLNCYLKKYGLCQVELKDLKSMETKNKITYFSKKLEEYRGVKKD